MLDLGQLLPHAKKDFKLDTKSDRGVINEVHVAYPECPVLLQDRRCALPSCKPCTCVGIASLAWSMPCKMSLGARPAANAHQW